MKHTNFHNEIESHSKPDWGVRISIGIIILAIVFIIVEHTGLADLFISLFEINGK